MRHRCRRPTPRTRRAILRPLVTTRLAWMSNYFAEDFVDLRPSCQPSATMGRHNAYLERNISAPKQEARWMQMSGGWLAARRQVMGLRGNKSIRKPSRTTETQTYVPCTVGCMGGERARPEAENIFARGLYCLEEIGSRYTSLPQSTSAEPVPHADRCG